MEHYIRCAEIWGGVGLADSDVCTRGLTASIFSRSADGEKGGDVYYFSVCGADLLTRVVIADLRGHGEQVSALSQWLYQALERRMNTLDGAGVLADLNGQVRAHGFQAMTTAAVLSYYIGDSNLYFSSAGHHPFLLRCSGGQWEAKPVEARGAGPANLPLGVLPVVRYDQDQARLRPGDRIFLCTDGILECPDASGEFFGEERLCQFLEANACLSLTEIKAVLLHELMRHAGGELTHDDCTFMILEVRDPITAVAQAV
jgi:sigma-B regulation protein RsbU (phosphoserine phosphatase)